MADYKDSPTWLKAMELATEVADVTRILAKADGMPVRETARDDYNRAAQEIPMDIAEAKILENSPRECLQFVKKAQGDVARFETRLLLDVRRGYVQQSHVDKALRLCEELGALILAAIEKLEAEERTAR